MHTRLVLASSPRPNFLRPAYEVMKLLKAWSQRQSTLTTHEFHTRIVHIIIISTIIISVLIDLAMNDKTKAKQETLGFDLGRNQLKK